VPDRDKRAFARPKAGDFGPDRGQFVGKGKLGRFHLDPPQVDGLMVAPNPQGIAKG
jgi:hypothetical protein